MIARVPTPQVLGQSKDSNSSSPKPAKGLERISKDPNRFQMILMDSKGFQRIPKDSKGLQWIPMDFKNSKIQRF